MKTYSFNGLWTSRAYLSHTNSTKCTGWWFQIFFLCSPLREMIPLTSICFKWVVKNHQLVTNSLGIQSYSQLMTTGYICMVYLLIPYRKKDCFLWDFLWSQGVRWIFTNPRLGQAVSFREGICPTEGCPVGSGWINGERISG